MEFWRAPLFPNLVIVAVLLAVAAMVRARVRAWARLAVPDAIVAGSLGLALGPSWLDLLPIDARSLELVVYHGFAVVFIAVGLQGAARVVARGSARALAFALPLVALLQTLLGFGLVAVWSAFADPEPHPGFAFMIMLGFANGPGQALAFGGAWETIGMQQGAQIGLVFAALGFLWCCVLGIPLVAWARARGWVDPIPEPITHVDAEVTVTGGGAGLEPVTAQLAAIACVYAAVFAILAAITPRMPAMIGASMWGFHFLFGSALAIGVRRVIDRRRLAVPLDDRLLGRISVSAVDFTTVAALAAIEVGAIGRWLVPILVIAAIAGVTTLLVCLWLMRRAFPEAPFSHALVLFGTCTGTLPTGFALLRMVDPELRGPVAGSTIVAATAAVPLGTPLFVLVIPLAIAGWDAGAWRSLGLPAIATTACTIALVWLWRRAGARR